MYFSKVLYMVALHRKCTRALTFENRDFDQLHGHPSERQGELDNTGGGRGDIQDLVRRGRTVPALQPPAEYLLREGVADGQGSAAVGVLEV